MAAIGTFNSGGTAWVMVCAALVLFRISGSAYFSLFELHGRDGTSERRSECI